MNENKHFSDENLVDQYIHLRLKGYPSKDAYVRVFVIPNNKEDIEKKIIDIENSCYFKSKIEELLENTELNKFWNKKIAVHELLSLLRNTELQEFTRINAIQELNKLLGLIEESHSTNIVKKIFDFYKQEKK